eukprot:scaffold26122_cov127-Cylindrotheca_fusiformis.AAC.2
MKSTTSIATDGQNTKQNLSYLGREEACSLVRELAIFSRTENPHVLKKWYVEANRINGKSFPPTQKQTEKDKEEEAMRFLGIALSALTLAKANRLKDAAAGSIRGVQVDEDAMWYDRMLQQGVGSFPTPAPSERPSKCSDVIDECPIDACFLPYDDPSRPPSCTDPLINRPDCDVLPTPTDIGCPFCCAFECRPDNPMFTPSPDGSPPVCSPTIMPSPAPSELSLTLSPDPTPSPSEMPSGCSDVIELCPIDACFLPDTDPSRPLDCTDPSVNRPDCDVLPTPTNIGCPFCCPFECRSDNPMFTPSPDGSPPACSPTMLPTPAFPEPSPAPSEMPSPLFPDPTPAPSETPTDCSDVIELCPIDACFLPFSDPSRPFDCSDPSINRPDCDVLPTPTDIGCPFCCPFECRPDNPMFTPSPDGSPPACSPTMMPSPAPSESSLTLSPDPTPPPSEMPSPPPSASPSTQPTDCSDVIELCPIDACFLPDSDPARPLDCTDPSIDRPDCDVLPTPTNINCPTCCAFECRADNPMFSPSPDGSPPVCSPTLMPSAAPSVAPLALPTPLPTPPPTPAPSAAPSDLPTALPTTTDCGIDVNINAQCSTSCSFDTCVERPFRMVMFYRGGGCQNTQFRRCPVRDPDPTPELPNPDPCTCTKEDLPCDQWNNNNECFDYNPETGNQCNSVEDFCDNNQDTTPIPGCGPPPNNVQHTVWIEAFGKDGEPYFAGPVQNNSTWTALTTDDEVSANTDIFTYEYVNGAKGRLLQEVVFHSSCSEELFLTDQFGSQQLIEFESFCDTDRCDPGCRNGRRTISLFQDQIDDFEFTLEARTDDQNPVTLRFVAAVLTPLSFQPPFFGETQFQVFGDLNGTLIPPDVTVTPNFTLRVDEEYTIAGVVVGERSNGNCDAFGQADLACSRVPRCDLVPDDCDCDPFGNGKGGKGGKGKKTGAYDGTEQSALESFSHYFGK